MRFPRKLCRTRFIWAVLSVAGTLLLLLVLQQISNVVLSDMTGRQWTVMRLTQRSQMKERDVPPPKKEVQHVAFLKVHKAASSTAQNIFLRYGWYRNLTFVLSPAKNKFGYPNVISLLESLTNSNILQPPPGKNFDILCNHVFYSYEAFSSFMPKDTAFIGILREPFEQYKSTLNYFRPRYIFKVINAEHPASEFLRNPVEHEPKNLTASWTNNRQAIEFGFPEELWKPFNATAVNAYLKKLDKEFKVIIIAELFEESVIIMRRALGWQTKDILYLDKNIARYKNETMISQDFDRKFYRQYAKLDYALYEYFFKRLREQIRQEGSDFDSEYLYFKDLRKNLQEFCRQSFKPIMEVAESPWGDAFSVTSADCAEMSRGEKDFVQRIRLRQYGSKDI